MGVTAMVNKKVPGPPVPRTESAKFAKSSGQSQKFFGSFFQKKNKHFFLKKEAKTFIYLRHSLA
jgi:hypothetical protein